MSVEAHFLMMGKTAVFFHTSHHSKGAIEPLSSPVLGAVGTLQWPLIPILTQGMRRGKQQMMNKAWTLRPPWWMPYHGAGPHEAGQVPQGTAASTT